MGADLAQLLGMLVLFLLVLAVGGSIADRFDEDRRDARRRNPRRSR
jgi:hypothetical protein